MNSFFKKNIRGFTLMEILVTVSLVAMISLAIYRCLSIGIEVWKRNRQYIAEEDVALFLDKITKDLNNALPFSLISLEGNAQSFAFPTRVHTRTDSRKTQEIEYEDQIGKVEYSFDNEKNQLLRRQANYSQAIDDLWGESRVLGKSLEKVRFHYFYWIEEKEGFFDNAKDRLPLGLEVEVEIKDNKGKRVISKYINIPRGGEVPLI